MKKYNHGFILPFLLLIILALLVGGGAYIYTQKAQVTENTSLTTTAIDETNNLNQGSNNPATAQQFSANANTTVTLDLSTAYAKQYKTILSEALKQPANFNEHYVIASMGCGTGCFTYVAVDKNNGKVYPAPTENDLGQFSGEINLGQANSLHSNLLKVIVENGSKINTYKFDGTTFTLVSAEKLYTSQKLNISFKYPSAWTAIEGNDYPGSAQGNDYIKISKGSEFIYTSAKKDCIEHYTICKPSTDEKISPYGWPFFSTQSTNQETKNALDAIVKTVTVLK